MEIGFGEALLIVGLLLAVGMGIGLAEAGVVEFDPSDEAVVHLVELALILTLFSDGLFVERELLRIHWIPPTRAIAVAMPITLALIAAGALVLFPELSVAEAFLLAAVLTPTDPVVTSAVVTARRVPAVVRHTLNLESGLNDGL